MKTGRLFSILMAALVVATLGITGQAMADGWTFMQGNTAVVEHPDRVNWQRVMAQGFDLDLKHGQTTRVHTGVQTPIVAGTSPSGTKADKIRLQIYTGSDLKVTKVLIYEAAYVVQEIIAQYQGDGVHYFWQEIAIDSSNPFTYGFGVSLEITAGTNSSLDHRFCLATAGVHWIGTGADAAVNVVADAPQSLQDRPEPEPVSPLPPPRKTGER